MMLLEDFPTAAVSLADHDIHISSEPTLAGLFLINIECLSGVFLAH